MKKLDVLKRSVVGVCAATLLTGLCAAPAFAADGFSEAAQSGSFTDNEATTVVSAEAATAGNISATLPVTVKAAVSPNGKLTFPTNMSIKVTPDDTNGTWPAKISGLSVDLSTSSFLKGLATSSAGMTSDTNGYITLNGTALTVGDNKDIVKSVTLDSSTNWTQGISLEGNLKDVSYAAAFTGVALVDLTWTISA